VRPGILQVFLISAIPVGAALVGATIAALRRFQTAPVATGATSKNGLPKGKPLSELVAGEEFATCSKS